MSFLNFIKLFISEVWTFGDIKLNFASHQLSAYRQYQLVTSIFDGAKMIKIESNSVMNTVVKRFSPIGTDYANSSIVTLDRVLLSEGARHRKMTEQRANIRLLSTLISHGSAETRRSSLLSYWAR